MYHDKEEEEEEDMYHDKEDDDGNLGSSKFPLPAVVGKVARPKKCF